MFLSNKLKMMNGHKPNNKLTMVIIIFLTINIGFLEMIFI